jgi:hypothetical protein
MAVCLYETHTSLHHAATHNSQPWEPQILLSPFAQNISDTLLTDGFVHKEEK